MISSLFDMLTHDVYRIYFYPKEPFRYDETKTIFSCDVTEIGSTEFDERLLAILKICNFKFEDLILATLKYNFPESWNYLRIKLTSNLT